MTAPWPVPDTYTLDEARLARYLPGHAPGETQIVKAWLSQDGPAYQAFAFNVRLGTGASVPADAPDSTKRFVRATTRKRVDIVAFRGQRVSLWEVKIQANLGALGQMLGYRHLWEQEYPSWPIESAGILCHLISADTAAVFARHALPFYLFPDIVLPPLQTVPP